MRISRGLTLAIVLGAAAAGGVTVGALTASPQRTPAPTPAVAAIPTSTPDTRTPAPTRTLTPTQAPTPTPAHTPAPVAQTSPAPVRPLPTAIATPRPTPTPEPRGRAVVFFASHQGIPVAVEEPRSVGGQSQSDHVFFRMAALRTTRAPGPPAYGNLFPTMKAVFAETTVYSPGVVTVGFIVGELYGDWGVKDEDVKLLLQQIVYTATEEPGIDRVLITQNSGEPAKIAGKTYDKPLAREDVR